jgi:hypothetical protein
MTGSERFRTHYLGVQSMSLRRSEPSAAEHFLKEPPQ